MTHYHPDHILLIALFENATYFDGDIIYEEDKETEYEGILPDTNIEVVLTPGHAHEHASLIVETEDLGTVVVGADVFWWVADEEQIVDTELLLKKEDPFTKDREALIESRQKLLDRADWIIPGHGKMFQAPN